MKYIARDEDIPYVRYGFPILDRVGHSYYHCGIQRRNASAGKDGRDSGSQGSGFLRHRI
ncbi:MAG: hypothetical protein R2941_09435 [Desulfobacterales bacterium]